LSGKGGVGKTTLVSNLGAALTKKGKSVIILDANISTPNLSLHLGIPFYPITLHDVLDGRYPIESAIYNHPSGLKVIPASLNIESVKNGDMEKFEKVLLDLMGQAEIILVDSSPGLSKEALKAMSIADEIIVVTNPEIPALTDALRTIKIAEDNGVKVLGAVVNRVKGHKHEISISEIKTMLDVPILEVVPEDINIPRSIAKMKPVVHHKPRSRSSKKFHRIASKIIGEPVEIIQRKTWLDRLLFWLV